MCKVVITIAKRGEGLAAPMDDRFGRAPRFLIVERDSGEVLETAPNPGLDAARGAGTGAAARVQQLGVDAAVSGTFGPNAVEALEAMGIQAWLAPAGLTAGQALEKLREGDLERVALKVYR
jgi:predicted Fe-Mo cluster-binding NifX family protein